MLVYIIYKIKFCKQVICWRITGHERAWILLQAFFGIKILENIECMEKILFTSIEIVALSGSGIKLSSLWTKLGEKGFNLDDSYKKFLWENLKSRPELIYSEPKKGEDVTLTATLDTRHLALGIVQVLLQSSFVF